MKTIDEAYAEFVSKLFVKRNAGDDGLMHAAVGIAGEVGELIQAIEVGDGVNVIEELGDAEFYLEGARQVIGVTRDQVMESVPAFSVDRYVRNLVIAAADFLDGAKKVWVYGAAMDGPKLVNLLRRVESQMAAARYSMNVTREQTILSNMEKLQIRYPGGYSDKLAALRLDKRAA